MRIEAGEVERMRAKLEGAIKRPPLERVAGAIVNKTKLRAQLRTPKREGTLRQSAEAEAIVESGVKVRGRVKFGGLAEAYAQYQHERDELRHGPEVHPKSDPKGQAHYLYGNETSAWNAEMERAAQSMTEIALVETFRRPF